MLCDGPSPGLSPKGSMNGLILGGERRKMPGFATATEELVRVFHLWRGLATMNIRDFAGGVSLKRWG